MSAEQTASPAPSPPGGRGPGRQPKRRPAPRVPAPARWMLPSVGGLCLLLVLYLLAINSWRFLQDSDTGWHIRTGDLILRTGTVPRQDVFSHTMPGHEWFAWEWLSDVLMSLLHNRWGLAGLVGGTMLLLCAGYALLFRLMVARGADAFVACGLTVFAAIASIIHWLARPHVVSIVLMLCWCAMIESWRRHRRLAGEWRAKWVYALPLLLALWANLHGAFAAMFPMLVIYAVGETLEFASRRELKSREFRRVVRTYAIVGAASVIAPLATPYGLKLYRHLWQYLTDAQLLARIQEFQSPDFHTLDGRLIELLLFFGVIAGARAAWQRRFVEVGLLIFWSHLTLQSERHVTLAAVVLTPIIAEHFSALLGEAANAIANGQGSMARRWRAALDWYRGTMAIDRQLTGAFVNFAVAAFLLVLIGGRWGKLTDAVLHPHFDAQKLPVAAADFIATARPDGNLYAPDQFGGYLIYRFYPRLKVFVDGRSDFYRTGPVFDESLRLATARPGWAEVLDKYDVRWMLLRTDEPLAAAAQATGRWVSLYRDNTAQILVKKEEAESKK
ncbi:MAG TPA: hypothetical protein VFD58_04785 [Blastocatellia bacterium]|nr:hypothetical protein [Blastocatellia bacterium]